MNAADRTFTAERIKPDRRRSRILPREQGAVSLDLVIGVMAFLAALTLGCVLVAERSAQSWQAGLSGRLTVQIMPEGGTPPENEVKATLDLLHATRGVAYADVLSDADNLALIEPFLGNDPVVAALPFPKVIDVRLTPGAVLDTADLTARLKSAAPHSVLDDHGRWIGRLRATANGVVVAALAIMGLIAMGTAATVAFATRAGLAAHREIVQLLHLMGAKDRFIARAFEWHYFIAALAASLCGAILAGLAFTAAHQLDGTAVASLLPPLGLTPFELGWLGLVPIAAAFIAWFTARVSVMSALREFY